MLGVITQNIIHVSMPLIKLLKACVLKDFKTHFLIKFLNKINILVIISTLGLDHLPLATLCYVAEEQRRS